MPKVKISEYSSTANSNTDVASINIDEGCAPSGINNAIRAVMGHLKDFQVGTNGDPFNGPVNGTVGATTPAAGAFTTLSATGNVTLGDASTDTLNVGNGGLIKDASGNVGVGVTPSPNSLTSGALDLKNGMGLFGFGNGFNLSANAYYDTAWKYKATAAATLYTQGSGGQHQWSTAASGTAGNAITFTQAMTLDAGNLLVGQTAQTTTEKLGVTNSGNNDGLYVINGSANPTGYGISSNLTSGTGTVTNTAFLYRGRSNATDRFYVYGNGGIGNYSANNVNLSDERTKTDIQTAGGYLAKICAIPVRTFKYKDQTDDLLNLGVIAQEVEAVAPELVDVSGFGETPEDGVPLKAIYQTDLQYALMKCIQEQQAMIASQSTLITSLTARLDAANL
jgi:hypothetical protein